MPSPHRLPGFAYIPPIAEESCKRAFVAASAQLRTLRHFSVKATTAFEQMTQRLATPDAGFAATREESAREGLYIKERGKFEHGRLQGLGLYQPREIVAAHISWDMGLPHVAYGITQVPFRSDPVVYTLAPRREAYDYGVLFSDNNFEKLYQTKPNLLPTFFALTVLDTALIANDRHANNLIYLPPKPGTPEALVGIDLDRTNWHFSNYHPDNKLYLRPEVRRALRLIDCDAASLTMIRATLTAFETYPVSRAERIARRLTPIVPVIWNPCEIAETLHQRQKRVREDYAQLLKPVYQADILAV